MDEVCDEKVQKISAHCNSDNMERVRTIRPAERDCRELVRAGELIRRKALGSTFSRRAVLVNHPRCVTHIPYKGEQHLYTEQATGVDLKKCCKRLRTPNLLEACLQREIM